MTLIQVGNSEGMRRCDARCYNAAGGECDCICGGKNHGAGLEQARENTRELADAWLDRFAAERGITRAELNAELGVSTGRLL